MLNPQPTMTPTSPDDLLPELARYGTVGRSRARVAVVDATTARTPLVVLLESAGYAVTVLPWRGQRAAVDGADVVVVGPSLRMSDRLECLASIARGRHVTATPITIDVTDERTDAARVRALRVGADDAVGPTTTSDEFVARVEAHLRRFAPQRSSETVCAGPLKIDASSRDAWIDGEVLDLTTKEFDLLLFLASHPGRVYTRQQLLIEVWHSSPAYQTQATVTEHIRRLRAKLGHHEDLIRTVRGVGYRFDRRRTEELRDGASAGR